MKKIIIFLLCISMCMTSLRLQGQPSRITAFALNDTIEKVIVRELSYPSAISYVETASEHLFIYNDGNLNIRVVPILSGYSVTDFKIVDDKVYFCANRSGGAVFGMFEWYDFFFGTETYYVNSVQMYTMTSHVNTLEKMVAYKLGDTVELVAVGKTALGRECVAEMQYSASSWSYRVGELGTNTYDHLLNITQTDDYVIVTGSRYYVPSIMCLRVFDKSDLFANLGLQDSSVAFYHRACQFDTNQMVPTHITGNIFLVASHWKDNALTSNDTTYKGTAIGYFQVSSSSNPYVDYYWTTQFNQPYINGGWKLREMTSPTTSSGQYFLLQDAEIGSVSGLVSMVFDLSYTVIYGSSVPVSYSLEDSYYSISRYGSSGSQYIMNGLKKSDSTWLKYNESVAGAYPCMRDTTFSAVISYAIRRNFLDAFLVTGFVSMPMKTLIGGTKQGYTGSILCPSKIDITKEEE